jgi:hypothetical protein
MHRSIALAATLATTIVTGGAADAQSVRGMFVEFPSGRPIVDAEVRLWADTVTLVSTTRTDSTGTFVVRAPTIGKYVINVRKVGFMGGQTDTLDLATTGEYEIVIRTPRVAPTLGAVVVKAPGIGDRMWAEGFQQRREGGFGSFLDAGQIAERGATTVDNILRGMPGVRIQLGAYGRFLVLSSRDGCPMSIYIDGSPGDVDMLMAHVRPADVEAIEAYSAQVDVPPIFRRSATRSCGVLAIWTRSRAVRGP